MKLKEKWGDIGTLYLGGLFMKDEHGWWLHVGNGMYEPPRQAITRSVWFGLFLLLCAVGLLVLALHLKGAF